MGNPNPHTILSPRQQITSSPYAIQTLNAQQLGGLPANRYVATDANGKAAIGPGTPAHRLAVLGGPCWTGDCWGGALELENSSAIAWRANTSNVKFGIGRTENGLFFFRTLSPLGTTTNGPIYDFKMDNEGKVGIGNLGISTDLSGARLSLFNTEAGYGLKHTDGIVKLGTYIGVTAPDNIRAGWFGTETNHRLHFFVNNGNPSVTLDTTGNVGIGTVSPTAKLHVNGSNSIGILAASQGNAVIGNSTGAGFAAVFGENTSGSGGFGVYGKGTSGFAMFAEGNAGQSLNKGGFVKAMVYVNGDGNIIRCYNGQTGSSSGTCGFTAGKIDFTEPGHYFVDFNFQVSDRFISVSVEDDGFFEQAGVSYTPSANNDSIRVFTFEISTGRSDRPFMAIVY
jgi:hypothetical protein